jgi:hypothetical protein
MPASTGKPFFPNKASKEFPEVGAIHDRGMALPEAGSGPDRETIQSALSGDCLDK